MLTVKQKQVLETIEYFIKEHGYAPTYREIAHILGVKNINCIYSRIRYLEQGGYISTVNGKARSIKVIKKGLNCEKNAFFFGKLFKNHTSDWILKKK